jgi:polyisoprenoid-binding protein YceI
MVICGRGGSPGLALAVTLLLSSGAMAAPAEGQDPVLELDPAGTHIDFTVGGFPHSVHGTFALRRGNIRFDPATGRADGLVVADAASGDSGNRSRDGEMRESILEAQRYPEIRFVPQQVDGHVAAQGESRVKIRGVLSLHGAAHEVTLDMVIRLAGEELTASGQLIVPYVEWGMRDPSIFIFRVSDKVEIKISAAGRVARPPTARVTSGGISGESEH